MTAQAGKEPDPDNIISNGSSPEIPSRHSTTFPTRTKTGLPFMRDSQSFEANPPLCTFPSPVLTTDYAPATSPVVNRPEVGIKHCQKVNLNLPTAQPHCVPTPEHDVVQRRVTKLSSDQASSSLFVDSSCPVKDLGDNFSAAELIREPLSTRDKGKGKADASRTVNEIESQARPVKEEEGAFNFTGSRKYELYAAWRSGGAAGALRNQAAPCVPACSPAQEEEEEVIEISKEEFYATEDLHDAGKSKRDDDDEFVASCGEDNSEDSDWSPKARSSKKKKKAIKRKFGDSGLDQLEQRRYYKQAKRADVSSQRAKGARDEKLEKDSKHELSSLRTAAHLFKVTGEHSSDVPPSSSLGKRKLTIDEMLTFAKRLKIISEDVEHHNEGSNIHTTKTKTLQRMELKQKKVKTRKRMPDSGRTSEPLSCPEEGCYKVFKTVTDLKRHVRKHPPSRSTIPWLQANGEDLSNGLMTKIECTVPHCHNVYARRDVLTRHQRTDHKLLLAKEPNSDIWKGVEIYVNVDEFLV